MNDHIPDVTKMISDTPISDSTPHNVADLGMLCRRMERELNAANQRIKRLEEFANRFLNPDDLGWAIGKHDRDEAREALGKERVESK